MSLTAESGPAAASTMLCNRWTDMWNGFVPATEVVTADCRVYFGRKPQTARPTATTGPQELQGVIDVIRERIPGIRYCVNSLPCYQAHSNTTGIITLLWNVIVPDQGTMTGIDLLRHEGTLIAEVWSITGDLELPVMQ